MAKIIAPKIVTPATAANGWNGIGGVSSTDKTADGTSTSHDANAIRQFSFRTFRTFDAVSRSVKKLSSVWSSKSALKSCAVSNVSLVNINDTSALPNAGKS